jgi:iron complex outermembrane recepter protein
MNTDHRDLGAAACLPLKTAVFVISCVSLFGMDAAYAQTAAQPEQSLAEVVVTATHIIRDGYSAPTPLTVLDGDAIAQAKTSTTIADVLNAMPVFQGNFTPAAGAVSISGGSNGLNTINLRAAGTGRSLILIDGQRTVPTVPGGSVDINNIPQQLISRVDIVTGGASAVYGSDAVVGVVNFVLDKTFTGFKGEVGGGITDYGDDKNHNIELAFGSKFANGRGHVLLSGEWAKSDGVLSNPGGRGWTAGTTGIMNNPTYTATNGQPQFLVVGQLAVSTATQGGIIFAGPLRGIAFGPGGSPYNFAYGALTADPFTAGGNAQPLLFRYRTANSLDPSINRHSLFGRVSYDLTDNINAYVQWGWNDSFSNDVNFPPHLPGTAGPVILTGNPFIPASIQSQMTTLALPSIQIGTFDQDIGSMTTTTDRRTSRISGGLSGSFEALSHKWHWSAYAMRGTALNTDKSNNVFLRSRYKLATDAVRASNGAIVCRSSLTDPTNGCIPWNPMGTGVNSQAALQYIAPLVGPYRYEATTETVEEATLAGEPFSIWAGPVSVAFSLQHREDKMNIVGDTPSLTNDWFAGNTLPVTGRNSVSEGSAEFVVPLASKARFADNWDLSAAYRGTNYHYSGYVATWKVGTTFAPIQDIKFRFNRSRDIRAPSLTDLFVAGSTVQGVVFDPVLNRSYSAFVTIGANPNLLPEVGQNTDIGVVIQPRVVPGLTFSVDWWNVDIKGGIGALNANQLLAVCATGNQAACSTITRVNGVVTAVQGSALNLSSERYRGLDFEGSYTMPLSRIRTAWRGDVNLHVNATHYLSRSVDPGVPGLLPTDLVGALGGNAPTGISNDGPPNWQITGRLSYSLNPFVATLSGRYRSAGVIDNSWIACTTGCPAATANNPTVNFNRTDGYVYLDAAFSYRFKYHGADFESFLNIKNVTNKDPGIVYLGPSGPTYFKPISYPDVFDTLGRVYRIGVRFKL